MNEEGCNFQNQGREIVVRPKRPLPVGTSEESGHGDTFALVSKSGNNRGGTAEGRCKFLILLCPQRDSNSC
jgi:hypothetical protein